MEALCEHGVLPLDLAAGARQRLLVLPDLLLEDLVHVRGHLDLAQALHLPLLERQVLVQALRLERLRLEGRRLFRHRLLNLKEDIEACFFSKISFIYLFDLRVVFLQMELEVCGGLRALDGLPLVHLHGLLAHVELLVDCRQVGVKETLLLLQLADNLVLGLHLENKTSKLLAWHDSWVCLPEFGVC